MLHREIQIHRAPGAWPLTWPMGLTMLRLLLLPAFLWTLLVDARGVDRPHRWVAVGIVGIMALTDKLDGYLARRLNQTTKIGALLDPVADKLLIACSVILLSFDWVAAPGYTIPMWAVAAVYAKDLFVVIGAVVLLYIAGKVRIAPRPLGKLSTVLQLALVMATLVAPDLANIGGHARKVQLVLAGMVSAVALLACIDYGRQGWIQLRDRVPQEGKD